MVGSVLNTNCSILENCTSLRNRFFMYIEQLSVSLQLTIFRVSYKEVETVTHKQFYFNLLQQVQKTAVLVTLT